MRGVNRRLDGWLSAAQSSRPRGWWTGCPGRRTRGNGRVDSGVTSRWDSRARRHGTRTVRSWSGWRCAGWCCGLVAGSRVRAASAGARARAALGRRWRVAGIPRAARGNTRTPAAVGCWRRRAAPATSAPSPIPVPVAVALTIPSPVTITVAVAIPVIVVVCATSISVRKLVGESSTPRRRAIPRRRRTRSTPRGWRRRAPAIGLGRRDLAFLGRAGAAGILCTGR